MQSYNSFRVAQQQILEAAKILNLDEATIKLLSVPQLETSFTIPLRIMGKLKFSRHTAFSTILPGVLQKVEFAFTPKKPWIQFVH